MKSLSIILFSIVLLNCRNQVNFEKSKINKESENNIIKEDTILKKENINLCDFSELLNDVKVPNYAKELFYRKSILNEDELFFILGKLKSKNKKERIFYFRVVTNSYDIADGAYGEGLGYEGKEFVDNNTEEFLSYFENKDCFNLEDLRKWSKILIMEIAIDSEIQKIDVIENYIIELKSKCKKCNSNQKMILIAFEKYLKNDWIEYIKNNE